MDDTDDDIDQSNARHWPGWRYLAENPESADAILAALRELAAEQSPDTRETA
jgi:hypothetical protein